MSMKRHNLFYCQSLSHDNLLRCLSTNVESILPKESVSSTRPKTISAIICTAVLFVVMSGCTSNAPTEQADVLVTDEPQSEVAATPASATEMVSSVDPNNVQPANVSTIPVALSIPAIEMEASVVEMGWIVTEVGGERTSRWAIPYSDAGWHVNSAGAGTNGNVVISGHQVVGEAIFAPLALGEVLVGEEILITDIRGQVFAYEVVEITEPIPLAGATDEETALAASYIAPASTAKLTLMTGWPDFATTHHLFVVADLVGMIE